MRLWTPLGALRSYIETRVDAGVEVRVKAAVEAIEMGTQFAAPDIFEEAYEKAYQAHSAVYACVSVIADNMAQIPFGVYQRKMVAGKMTRTLVEDHAINELLRKPNPWFSGFDLMEQTAGYQEITGNCYWFLGRGQGTGTVKEIVTLRPDRIQINPSKNNYVESYTYQVDGTSTTILAEDIMHFKYFNPHNDYYGQSPLQAARHAYVNDQHAIKFNTAFFKNGAEIGALLTFENTVEPEQKKRVLAEIQKAFVGSSNRGKVLVIDGGSPKWERMGITQRDMDFILARKMNRSEIGSVYRVPPVMLNSYEQANYNTAQQQRLQFHQENIVPKLSRMRAFLNLNMGKLDPRSANNKELFIDFDLSGVPALKKEEIERMRLEIEMIRMGAFTINETRERRNLPPTAWGDDWYLSRSQIPVSELMKNPSGVTAPPGKPPERSLTVDELLKKVGVEDG